MIKLIVNEINYEMKSIQRDWWNWIIPVVFFVMVAALFPLAIGNNPELLTQIASGIIWIAALLATLLSCGNLFKNDAQSGHLDVLLTGALPVSAILFCKIACHWLAFCGPLILITPLLGIFFKMEVAHIQLLIITLLLGTPILCLLAASLAALTINLENKNLLLPLLIMPLFIPILIFGTGIVLATPAEVSAGLALLGAMLLLSIGFLPLMTMLALKVGVN